MNKYLLKIVSVTFALSILLLFTQCNKDNAPVIKEEDNNKDTIEAKVEIEYSTKRRAIIQEYTSTGCPGCGSWGAPSFEHFIKENSDVVPIAVHIKYGDPMITDVSNALADNRVGRRWTPQNAIGHTQCVVISPTNSIDNASSLIKMDEEYAAIIKEEQQVKVGASYKVEGNKIKIYYGAQATNGSTDEFYFSAYVMENGVVADQTSGDNTHNHVIRAATEGAFGVVFFRK